MDRTRRLDRGLVNGRNRRNLAVHRGVDECRVGAFADLHRRGFHDLYPGSSAQIASQTQEQHGEAPSM